jgi:hypothetical protein
MSPEPPGLMAIVFFAGKPAVAMTTPSPTTGV